MLEHIMAKSKKNSKIHLDITAEKRQKLESYHCTIEAGIAMIGGKYKIMILHHLKLCQRQRQKCSLNS